MAKIVTSLQESWRLAGRWDPYFKNASKWILPKPEWVWKDSSSSEVPEGNSAKSTPWLQPSDILVMLSPWFMTVEVDLDHPNEVVFVRLLHCKVTPIHNSYCLLWGQSGSTAHVKEWGVTPPLWEVELPQVYFCILFFFYFPNTLLFFFYFTTWWPSYIYMHIFFFLTLSCSIISD